MAQRLVRGTLQRRLYGSSASAPKAAAKAVPAAEVQVGKASNGIKVATQESHSALARVVCAVKAGSRYEDSSQRGVAHCLRATTDLTQKEARAYGLTRDLHQMGANISCTSSREHLIYTLEVPQSNVHSALPYLAGMVAGQSFRPWEISDTLPRIEYEIVSLAEQPEKRAVEKVHEAAYREQGLGRSLYAPLFQLSEFSPDMLQEYVNKNFSPDRITLSASGVALNDLIAAAAKFDTGVAGSAVASSAKYFGGEMRENSEDLLAYSVLVGEGASLSSDEVWAFAVLEQLLGSGPQIKWASNTTSNKLNALLSQKTQEPYHVQSFNANYSDSGLFGVSAVTVPQNSELVLKTVVEQLKEMSAKPVDASVLQGAKNRVKTSVAFQAECPSDAVQARAIDLMNRSEVQDIAKALGAVDAVSASAVQNAAKKVVGSKLTMASIGEIYNVPYLDQL